MFTPEKKDSGTHVRVDSQSCLTQRVVLVTYYANDNKRLHLPTPKRQAFKNTMNYAKSTTTI